MNLIIGNGLIGRHLYYSLRGDSVLLTRKEVDLSKDSWEIPKSEVAYICAGVTSTEECESHPEESRLINITNTVKLAEKLKSSKVVWISSERVFDGSEPNRKVSDGICPTTEYGRQKAEAEKELLGLGVIVIRFGKVIGWHIPLFEEWISQLKKGFPISPYSNVAMSPIPISCAVSVLRKLGNEESKGLFQLSADGDITYSQIAYQIANFMCKDFNLVHPIESEHPRPYSSLESNVTGVDVPNAWKAILDWCEQRI